MKNKWLCEDEKVILYGIGIMSFINFCIDIYIVVAKG